MMELEHGNYYIGIKSLSFSDDNRLSPIVNYYADEDEEKVKSLEAIYFWKQLSILNREAAVSMKKVDQTRDIWSILLKLNLKCDNLTMEYVFEEDCYRIRPLVAKAPSQDIILTVYDNNAFELDCKDRILVLDKFFGSKESTREHYKYNYLVPLTELASINNTIGEICQLILPNK